MKIYILLLLSILQVSSLKSQTPYYDAKELLNLTDSLGKFKTDSVSESEVYKILRNYLPQDLKNKVDLQKARINREFIKNDFIKKRFNRNLDASSLVEPGNFFSSVGNLDVTAFADGFAQFLVERAKEELNEAFFRKFADFLDYHPEFTTLFPNTKAVINNFKSWEYANILNTLRESFDKDIKELLANFIKLKDLSAADCPVTCAGINSSKSCTDCNTRKTAISNFFKTNAGIQLLSATQIGNGILQNQKIPDILNSITQPAFLLGYTDNARPAIVSDLKNSLKLINILSLSLKSNETGRHYITNAEFDLLRTDSVLRNLYLGLLWQQIKNDSITISGTDVTTFFTPGNLNSINNYITNLFNQSKSVQKAYDKILADRLDAKADLNPDYAVVFESVQHLLSAASSISMINSTLQFPPIIDTVFNLASKTLQIAHDVEVRNYNAVIVGTLKLLSDKIPQNDTNLKNFAASFLKYGSFAANVVLAKDANQVKDAIKAFALPSGSSSIKRHSTFNISLNAYVGLYLGSEKIKGIDDNFKPNTYGITAPVGFAISRGIHPDEKYGSSISLFLSVIDLGAPVAFRFKDDKTEQIPTIQLKNIISPGVFLSYGFPRVPLSANIGWQLGPQLRSIDPSMASKAKSTYSRVSISFDVDIPVLNIFLPNKGN